MFGKPSYKSKLLQYFLVVFISFTAAIAAFQYNREKQYKEQELKAILNSYTEIVDSYMHNKQIFENKDFALIDSIIEIFPRNDIRITVIDLEGYVLFDNFYKDYQELENHKLRPEVKQALYSGSGSDIRSSTSTKQKYYYYARLYDQCFVRAAVIYSVKIKELLKVENVFLVFLVFLFIVITIVLFYVSDKMGKSILSLKNFAVKAASNEDLDYSIQFPENELGIIGKQIISIYKNLKKTNRELNNERDKLFHHLQISQEGIAIFSKTNEKILANNHFVQYLNLISDIPTINASHFLDVKELKPIKNLIKKYTRKEIEILERNLPMESVMVEKNNYFFDVRCIIFHDRSYEVTITDVTKAQKRKVLKQQMTSNIAHELRTPVSSIKAYLETIINGKGLSVEKQRYFAEKANIQSERLSELIRDISILTNIEEASGLYQLEDVNINSTVADVVENLQLKINASKATVKIHIEPETIVQGNKALMYSIFQNLFENSLNYAGEKIIISIDKYLEESQYVYFSFSDNGMGIEEEHQNRIFERFYRIEKGRARNKGGTGLGLAIVKNAVQFHNGNISVKTRVGGGVEFLFTLKK